MPSSSIASANKEVKSVPECRSHKPRSQTSSLLSVDRKREVSKLNVGVVLIIAIREISNHENEFDFNSRNIRPSKITRYTVASLMYRLVVQQWPHCIVLVSVWFYTDTPVYFPRTGQATKKKMQQTNLVHSIMLIVHRLSKSGCDLKMWACTSCSPPPPPPTQIIQIKPR